MKKKEKHQISEEQHSAPAMDLEPAIYKKIFQKAHQGISITNTKGDILVVNPAFTKITGYSLSEIVGENPRILNSGKHKSTFFENIWKIIEEKGFWTGEVWNKKKEWRVVSPNDDNFRIEHDGSCISLCGDIFRCN